MMTRTNSGTTAGTEMGTDMASEALLELKGIVDSSVELSEYSSPPTERVSELLNALAEAVGMSDVIEGPNTRRAEAVQNGAYQIITKIWTGFFHVGAGAYSRVAESTDETEEILGATLKALYSITPGFPDIVDNTAFSMIRQSFNYRLPESFQILGMKIIKNICTKSEVNRDTFVNAQALTPALVYLIKRRYPSAAFLREWCSAVRTLIQSDDRRVSYNRSAERRKLLAQEAVIKYVVKYLTSGDFFDGVTQNAIIILLGAFGSREEYVESMVKYGILDALPKILLTKYSNALLAQHTLVLLKYMCMSARVRSHVSDHDIMRHVLKLLYLYRERPEMLEPAMSCLAYMTLRCPRHIECVLFRDGVKDIMDTITKYNDSESVLMLKSACFLLRNIAVHGMENGRKTILDNDGENIIHQIEEKNPKLKYNYTKPLIRDLKLPVTPTMPPKTTSADLISPIIGIPGQLQDFKENRSGEDLDEWNVNSCVKRSNFVPMSNVQLQPPTTVHSVPSVPSQRQSQLLPYRF